MVVEAIKTNSLERILRFDRGMVEKAKPDSLWQMAMLAGVLETEKMVSELLSYNVPTYFGMICARFTPVQN